MSLLGIKLRSKKAEPIALLRKRHNYFPRQFLWRGQEYSVHAVERAWTEMRRGGKNARHYFRVRCAAGTVDLFQDIRLDAWYLEAEPSR